ncbi:MAG: hypothetical protein DHS20C15_07310 [Planctomycetota bacterium]|nr:MAG: hypothetical protein DHS20C15_07310 [Planctomycetota bacterium]
MQPMQPKNRLTEYLSGEAQGTARGSAFEAAADATDPQPEVERHVARVRGSVALLLRSLDVLKDTDQGDETDLVDSCLGCADALEDLLVFLFPQARDNNDEN